MKGATEIDLSLAADLASALITPFRAARSRVYQGVLEGVEELLPDGGGEARLHGSRMTVRPVAEALTEEAVARIAAEWIKRKSN